MEKLIYKAYVYLAATLDGKVPCLSTSESENKEEVLAYVKALHEAGIAAGYRMLYNTSREINRWILDSEVVYIERNFKLAGGFKINS